MASEGKRRERREQDRRGNDRRVDALGPALQGIGAEALDQILGCKDARIEIRVDRATKARMEQLAARYGLTLTSYLLRLHTLVEETLGREA